MPPEIPQAKPFQTDHLILLIGSNPLPNFVAAEVLCPTGKLYLLHSNSTEDIAKKLAHRCGLERCPLDHLKSIGQDEANPQKVYTMVEELLVGMPKNETVGLHYTGGTKVMSVHAYRAALNSNRAVICSYADAQTLEMVISQGKTERQDERFFIGDAVQIGVRKLLELHNLDLSQDPKTETRLKIEEEGAVQLYQALAETCQNHLPEWREWCHANFRQTDEARQMAANPHVSWQDIAKKAGKFKAKSKLKAIELPDIPNLASIRQFFTAHFPGISPLNLGELGKLCGFVKSDDLPDFARWLDGEWLEDYVLRVLCKLQAEGYHLYQPGMDYKAKKPEFQFDVAVTRGYQLFAFSCTTSDDKPLCKSKLFEAYVRAQQMGGDEAKTALVCCIDDPDNLQAEMVREFKAEAKIKVFGRNDLPYLKERLKFWFDQT